MLKPEHRLDTTGLLCPLPILLTARVMDSLAVGDQLEVIGDDPGILEDMPAWCAQTGHHLESIEDRGGTIHCRLRKALAAPPAEPQPDPS